MLKLIKDLLESFQAPMETTQPNQIISSVTNVEDIKDLLESFQAPMERSTILLTTSTYTNRSPPPLYTLLICPIYAMWDFDFFFNSHDPSSKSQDLV